MSEILVDQSQTKKVSPPYFKKIQEFPKTYKPLAPFTTSTLQQDANKKLHLSTKETMRIAQGLYENGFITYMRTDSLRISAEAETAAKEFILRNYGSEYYPPSPRVYKAGKGAQDAHEAIRPISLKIKPEDIKDKVQKNYYKLYIIFCIYFPS